MPKLIAKSACLLFIIISINLSGCKDPFHDGGTAESSARGVQNPLDDIKIFADWNKQSDDVICDAIEANNSLISIGTDFIPRENEKNTQALDDLENYLLENYGDALMIAGRENRLSILNVEIIDCSVLGEIRDLDNVHFVEPKYLAPIDEEDIFDSALEMQARALANPRDDSDEEDLKEEVNPGFYDPNDFDLSYPEYIRNINSKSADIMERHNIDKIYEEFGHYGTPNIGVAVIDNGVVADKMDFLSQGQGYFDAIGYYRPFSLDAATSDGPHPRAYDLYGITPLIKSIFEHGTRQSERVYYVSPHVNLLSVRSSPFVFWFLPTQFQGVTESILDLAENPDIRIISSSMGTVIHIHEIERAIDYFNAFDKIFISAAGTSAPLLKDIVKIVFPANLTTTISTTGLADTAETGGKFILGEAAHGGPENDFVVDHTDASSESVSTSAGMFALVWSAAPSLTREQVIDIMIRSSSSYQSKGKKDSVFGWGKIDLYQAFVEARKLAAE
ncbi:MAG: S8/S53 family peptidase [Pseudomonadales bacterium]|nr:S8/S53 family peptidase [Pseudomonadales bacterium]